MIYIHNIIIRYLQKQCTDKMKINEAGCMADRTEITMTCRLQIQEEAKWVARTSGDRSKRKMHKDRLSGYNYKRNWSKS